jgi:hypothetical protein
MMTSVMEPKAWESFEKLDSFSYIFATFMRCRGKVSVSGERYETKGAQSIHKFLKKQKLSKCSRVTQLSPTYSS